MKQDLDAEEKLLEARQEVAACKERTAFLQCTLDQACSGDLEVLVGYNSRIPALSPWPARRRTRRQPRAAKPSPDRSERKRKRSLSRAPPVGGAKRSAYGRPETSDARESTREREPETLSGHGRGAALDPGGGRSHAPPPLSVYTGRMTSVRRWGTCP